MDDGGVFVVGKIHLLPSWRTGDAVHSARAEELPQLVQRGELSAHAAARALTEEGRVDQVCEQHLAALTSGRPIPVGSITTSTIAPSRKAKFALLGEASTGLRLADEGLHEESREHSRKIRKGVVNSRGAISLDASWLATLLFTAALLTIVGNFVAATAGAGFLAVSATVLALLSRKSLRKSPPSS